MARGGKRKGAGRPTKVDEEKANHIFLTALKEIHKTDTDDETKIAFVKDLYDSQRGQMFIAEHIFGKPKETVENINHTIDSTLSKEEIKALKSEIINDY